MSSNRLPAKLSPSRAKDFMQCPKLFYYKTILGMATPSTEATARGTLCHYAFEQIFDHPRGERGVDTALSYLQPAWAMMTDPLVDRTTVVDGSPEDRLRIANKCYRDLHEPGSSSEERLLASAADYRSLFHSEADLDAFFAAAEQNVRGWYEMENPDKFDPAERELYLAAKVAGVTVHGFIDRLDRTTANTGEELLWISDYKTGKPPQARYADEAFFQLEVYALLAESRFGVRPYKLRLIYVREARPDAVLERRVTPQMLARTRAKLTSVWKAIQTADRTDTWTPRKQVLCDWCYFKDVCPAWRPELEGLLPEEITARLNGTATPAIDGDPAVELV